MQDPETKRRPGKTTPPAGGTGATAGGKIELADIIDIPAIQGMMDNFHGLTGIGMALSDLKGNILVATGWQDICTKFHRIHPETRRNCIESDTVLSSGIEPGTFKIYRCKNNLWDIATPIMLGDHHAGNLFLGQFIFEDEEPDREVFREQARRCGFDEAAYLAALDRLPRWSRERVTQAMTFYSAFARQISDLSYGNVKLARTLAQRNDLLVRLGENEERLRLALKATNDVVWDWDIVNDAQRWNESGTAVFGWADIVAEPQTAAWWIERVHPEDRERVEETFYSAVRDPVADRWSDEYRFRKADGTYAQVADRGHILRDADGRAVRMIGAMLDITEQKRVQEELRGSRETVQALINATDDCVFLMDVDGTILAYNKELTRRLGRPGADLTGENMYDSLPAPVARYRREWVAAVARSGRPRREEDRRSGRILDSTVYPLSDESGRVTRIAVFSRDITERKKAEQDLRESEARFAALFRSSPMAAAIVTVADGRLVDVNTGFERVFGHRREDCIGRTALDLGLWADPEERVELIRKAREEGAAHGVECRMRRATGEVLPVLISAEFVRIGETEFMLTMALDISRRKQAEETLRESEERFRAANDASLDALLLLRCDRDESGEVRDFIFVDLNRRAEEMLRISRRHLLGKRLCEELPINREAGFFEKYKRVVETGIPLEEEFFLPETHVPAAWYYHQVVRVGDGVFICHRDIGERKHTEEEREKLQAQLLQSQKMESVGRLAGGVAHDFNNLLMGIMGYAQLCQRKVEPDHPIREWLDEIVAESKRSADLVRQLLAFARKQAVKLRPLDLNEQIGGILKMLGRLIGERIELTWSPAPDLKLVNADPAQIGQIMANLCVNAADAIAGNGRVAIATRNIVLDAASAVDTPELIPGAYVRLTVTDTGCGMDAETQANAFEPFFTTKGVGRGTGLGLATVYGIVNQANGRIRIESAPGAGTTIRVYLPALEGAGKRSDPADADAPPPGGNETILVVDDERSVRVSTAIQLEQLGYRVLTAGHPKAALRQARDYAGTINLLLSDMVMPGMTGEELRNRLLRTRPALKTILITGYSTAEFLHRKTGESSTMRLIKPVQIRELAAAIRSVLAGGPPERE